MFGPLVSKPGSSKKNKTGSWRVELRPKFLRKECIGCKLCVSVCPEGCIEPVEKNVYEIAIPEETIRRARKTIDRMLCV